MREAYLRTGVIKIDFRLMLPFFLTSLISLLTLLGIGESFYFFKKQLLWHIIGIFLFILFLKFVSYTKLKENVFLYYFVCLLLLLVVLIIGKTAKGAQRWLIIGPISFQPSELAKLAIILVDAYLLALFTERGKIPLKFKDLGILLIPSLVLFVLTLVQPDLGTAIILLAISFVMALVAGIDKKTFFVCAVIASVCMYGGWHVLKPYQKNRIIAFINPYKDPQGRGYHIIQSKIAVGSGKLFGKGFMKGTQSKLRFVPERHTDFIFATYAEQWGFVGVIGLIGLYIYLLNELIRIALHSKTFFALYTTVGIITLFILHIFINIGMNLGMLPVVGVPLPLMSYGGTNVIVSYISLAIVTLFYCDRS